MVDEIVVNETHVDGTELIKLISGAVLLNVVEKASPDFAADLIKIYLAIILSTVVQSLWIKSALFDFTVQVFDPLVAKRLSWELFKILVLLAADCALFLMKSACLS